VINYNKVPKKERRFYIIG